MFLRVLFPHYIFKRAERACIFKPFFIFIFLEYRDVASLPVLLGTRRQIKIKNHLKSAAQRDNILARYGSALLGRQRKTKISLKILYRLGCSWQNFISSRKKSKFPQKYLPGFAHGLAL